MKTKKQILDWLDKQPWKGEFYEEVFLAGCGHKLPYDENLIKSAFIWSCTKSGMGTWRQRHKDFQKWYNGSGRPTTWEKYCNQNPIIGREYYIDEYSDILAAVPGARDKDADINVMPEKLCTAFRAYMKLIQLRNAWVKDCENGGDDNKYRRIVYTEERGFYGVRLGKTGLSFPTLAMAEDFINTFKDLLEVAKPLI